MLRDSKGASVFIDWIHYLIHEGRIFSVRERLTTDQVTQYLIESGEIPLHLMLMLKSSAACQIDYLANVTVQAQGALMPMMNRNGISTRTLKSKIYKGPTYTGGVPFLPDQSGFGSNPGSAKPGEAYGGVEFVLKPDAKYVMKITPLTSLTFVMEAEMYELVFEI